MTDGFDYGGTVAEKEEHFILWATSGNRTALVDADLLPYRVGYITDPIKELQAKQLVEDGHYSCIEDTPQFQDAFDSLCMTLNNWVRSAKCDSARLFATASDKNYRLRLAYTEDYKGQRNPEKPPFFSELKQAMIDKLGAVLSDGNEADDELSIAAWEVNYMLAEQGIELGSQMHKELCTTVTVSSDKDSAITPTWHYNPDTQQLYFSSPIGELIPKLSTKEVNDYQTVGTGVFWSRGAKAGQEKTKRVLVGKKMSSSITKLKGTGLKFFYAQIIMGDTADNYSGLKGKGITFAYELLNNCKTEAEMYYAVLNAYKEVYGEGTHICENYLGKKAELTAYDRMLEQGRMAWMQTKPNEIWREGKGRVICIDDKEIWK